MAPKTYAGVADKICHFCQRTITGDSVTEGAKLFCSELCHVAHLKKMPKPKKKECKFC